MYMKYLFLKIVATILETYAYGNNNITIKRYSFENIAH